MVPDPSPRRYAALALVGPNPIEPHRVADLVDALVHYEPGISAFVLVDDAPVGRDWSHVKALLPATCKFIVEVSPRQGRGAPLLGGGGMNLLVALRRIAQLAASGVDVGPFVMKLDTDALVIARFHERLARLLETNPDAGIIGACTISPLGKPRGVEFFSDLFARAGCLWLGRTDRAGLGRRRAWPTKMRHLRMYAHVHRALRAGYLLGENVSGGAYAVPTKVLLRVLEAGFLDRPETWRETSVTEDSLFPMYARAVGGKLVDSALSPDGLFGIVWRGLCAMPDDLVARNYAFIHCLKNDPRISENDIRAYFKRRRDAVHTNGEEKAA